MTAPAIKSNWKISFEDALNMFDPKKVKTNPKGQQTFSTLCPVHDDSSPSLSITEKEDGTALFKCFSCYNGTKEGNKSFMSKMNAFFRGEGFTSIESHAKRTKEIKDVNYLPLSLKHLARKKGFRNSSSMLEAWGVREGYHYGTQCVYIPYFLEDGSPYTRTRRRMLQEVEKEDGTKEIGNAPRWDGEGDLIPYGLNRLHHAREIGHLLLVEGESDCWTLWAHDLPALGIPGVSHTKTLKAEYLDGITSLYVVDEGGQGGKTFIRGLINRLHELEWEGDLYIMSMPDGCKDPNDLHLKTQDYNKFISEIGNVLSTAKKVDVGQEVQAMAEATAGVNETAATDNVVFMDGKRKEKQVENWMDQLDRGEKGGILNSAKNVLLILENDESLKGVFAYNQLSYKMEIIKSVPWKRLKNDKEITDFDDAALRNYLSIHYGMRGKDIINDATQQLALEKSYHPVMEYLSSLNEWDGIPRLDTLLVDYFGAPDTELNRVQTRLTFVGAVKRVFDPGCKFDYILTLKGAQGLGKSSFFETLAVKRDWFTDQLEDLKGKEAKEMIQGKWIVELGEMAAVGKGDQKRYKQFITSRWDEFRHAYGRRTNRYPRQCIFVASTNDDEPLKDDTGNRRWWMVEVKENWRKAEKGKPLEVDQIWAEAMHRYNEMEQEHIPLMLPQHLEEEAKKVQLDFTDQGTHAAEVRYILNELQYYKKYTYSSLTPVTENIRVDETCARHLWVEVLNKEDREFNPAKGREMTAILNNLEGWESVGQRKFVGSTDIVYGRPRVYRRKK